MALLAAKANRSGQAKLKHLTRSTTNTVPADKLVPRLEPSLRGRGSSWLERLDHQQLVAL